MENIQNLITNIYSKNLVEAKTLFESILHEKCSLTLENAKKEIAKTFLGDDVKEEVEQLDELSKNTLGSYIKKASSSSHENSAPNLASRGAYELGKNPDGNAGEADDMKSYKRSKFIGKAVDKILKK